MKSNAISKLSKQPQLLASRTALLVIDLQNDFCTANSRYAKLGYPVYDNARLAINIQNIVNKLRGLKVGIFYLISHYDHYKIKGVKCSYCLAGSYGARPYLNPDTKDVILIKKTHDGFYHTKLNYYLKKNSIKNLIIIGISTSVCVDTTARSAVCRGYNTIILEDGVTSRDLKLHRFALENFAKNFGYVTSSDIIIKHII